MDLLLTDKELVELTGYKFPSRQRSWLKDNGIGFYVNRFGRPRVSRAAFNQLSGVRIKKDPTPDFKALEALNGNK